MGAVHLLKGEYTFTDVGDNKADVRFQLVADLRGPFPEFIKLAIARLIVHIALDDLKTYVTSQRCIDTLAKYDAEAGKGAFHTLKKHITRHFIDVPDRVFGGQDGARKVARNAIKLAMAGLLMKRLFGTGSDQDPSAGQHGKLR